MVKTRRKHVNYNTMSSRYGGHYQKSGKWTSDEEALADRLIRGFQTGTLSDCAEGATLRSYLARKLNCAPMRISKKFAGLCIGKHTYVTNKTNDPQQTMWTTPTKSVGRQSRSPRNTRPLRCRQSPRSNLSSDSSQYHYYDSDETESSEEDDDVDTSSIATPPRSFNPIRNTRQVTLGSGATSAFTPISLRYPASPTTPSVSASSSAVVPVAASFLSALKMDEVDLNEVYHSSYSSTPSCCLGGTSCTAHHEEQQWREVLTTLFGGTDSSSPVRNIFTADASSAPVAKKEAASGHSSLAPVMCYASPPISPRAQAAVPTVSYSSGVAVRDFSGNSSSAAYAFAPSDFIRSNPFYPMFK